MPPRGALRETVVRSMSRVTLGRVSLVFRSAPSVIIAAVLPVITALAAPQGGEDCASAIVLPGPLPISVSGTTVGYSDDYDEVCPHPGSFAPDVVYSYAPPEDVIVDISLCAGATDFDTKLYVYESTCPDPGNPLACNDDGCVSAAGVSRVSVLPGVPLLAGSTYYIVVDGYGAEAGDYRLTLSESTMPGCPDDSLTLVAQPPALRSWRALTSDTAMHPSWAVRRLEGFSKLRRRITRVRFWGLQFAWPTEEVLRCECTEQPMQFEIRFYADDHGQPGAEVCSETLSITGAPVAEVGYGRHTVYEFEADLPQACALRDGWLSIVGTGGDPFCRFVWLASDEGDNRSRRLSGAVEPFDLALCLSTDDGMHSGACCDERTGACDDPVFLGDCAGRFVPDATCDSLAPPCEAASGACCYADGTCAISSYDQCVVAPACFGDMNCDGRVNIADVNPFVMALLDPDGYLARFPDCLWLNADCNEDGTVSFADINPMIVRLWSHCDHWLGPESTCPECAPPPIFLPDDLPVTVTGSTCQADNAYVGCPGAYTMGRDVIYDLVVRDAVDVQFSLTPSGYGGRPSDEGGSCLLLRDDRPGTGFCLAADMGWGEFTRSLPCATLEPGGYTLVVDTWPLDRCIQGFELSVEGCVRPAGRCCHGEPPVCEWIPEAECLMLGGDWDSDLDCNTPCTGSLGDDCPSAAPIAHLPFESIFDGDLLRADGPCGSCDRFAPSGPMQSDAWFVWAADSDCLATARALGDSTCGDVLLVVRQDCDDGEGLHCADRIGFDPARAERIDFAASAGNTYYFQVGHVGNHPCSGMITFQLSRSVGSGACCFVDGTCLDLLALQCLWQGGRYQGDGSGCASIDCPQPTPGDRCDDPINVTLSAASLPYANTNSTTDRNDDYDTTCLGRYDSGEDIVYQLEVLEPLNVEIVLDPHGARYTGLLLSDTCPPGGTCIARHIQSAGDPHGFDCLGLLPGQYYLMVDKWMAPSDILSFDLLIEACDAPLGACCVHPQCVGTMSKVDCRVLEGVWYKDRDCTSFTCPTGGGETCERAIGINVPMHLPFVDFNSTCDAGDDYHGNTCLGDYDSGQDRIYKLRLLPSGQTLDITLDSFGERWAGLAVSSDCPLIDTCIAVDTGYMKCEIKGLALTGGNVYYLMIDTWPPPDCLDYRLTVTLSDQPSSTRGRAR